MPMDSDRGRGGAATFMAKGIVDKVMGAAKSAPAERDRRDKREKEAVDARALLRLAEKHLRDGERAVACEVYARAGDVFVEQGFARRAISTYLQALECAKAQVATQDRVAPLAKTLAKLYAAEKLGRDALPILDAAATFLVERGADAHAVTVLETRVALVDEEIARVRLAEALLRLGQIDRGADQLSGVFTRLRASGQRDDAIEVAERLLHHRPDVEIARTCAELYLARNRAGDPFHALAKLRICCEGSGAQLSTLELLARAFELARHPDKAERVRREIAEMTAPPKPKKEDSVAVAASAIEAGWDDLMVQADKHIDVARPSFWAVSDAVGVTEDSVVEVSLADIELVDGAPQSEEHATLLETTLESVDALAAQARFDEAADLVNRQLALRPGSPLLLDRLREIEEMRSAEIEESAPALLDIVCWRDSERSVQTATRAAAV